MENVKIVIVEDENEIREMLVDTFEFFLNRKVTAFSSADSALEYILLSKPDLVISDTETGQGMSGIDLLKRVKQALPGTIFINMSGKAIYEAQAKANGSDGFLLKPFKLEDLVNIVEEFIVG